MPYPLSFFPICAVAWLYPELALRRDRVGQWVLLVAYVLYLFNPVKFDTRTYELINATP